MTIHVDVRAGAHNLDFVRAKLKSTGWMLTAEFTDNDSFFVREGEDIVLRLRERGENASLMLSGGKERPVEMLVGDADVTMKLIERLGFKKEREDTKEKEVYHSGRVRVCLGTNKVGESSVTASQEAANQDQVGIIRLKLSRVLKDLGIPPSEIED